MLTLEKPERWTLPLLASAFVAIALYTVCISHNRILWSDELFGFALLTDPSFTHMLSAWRAGADGGGIGFYLLGRLWLALFGPSALAFRAFSATGCFVAFTFAWLTLRQFYPPRLTAFTIFIVWFGSRTILWQMVQTRFYGMLLASAAFALYTSVRRPSATTNSLNLIANFFLLSTHPLSILYSALILTGAAIHDAIVRKARPMLYLTSILPWTILWFSREAMRNTAKAAIPHFWTKTPVPDDLLNMYLPAAMPFVGYIALAILLLLLLWPSRRRQLARALKSRSMLLIPALLLALTPIILWLISQHGTSIFVDRYMVPFTLGVAIFLAEALTQIFPRDIFRGHIIIGLATAGALSFTTYCVAQDALVEYPRVLDVPPLDFTAPLIERIPPNLPIVFEQPDIFDVTLFRHPNIPAVYLLDWPVAIDPASARGLASGFHEMQTWQQVGYFATNIRDVDTFLRSNREFIVVDNPSSIWLSRRILADPTWEANQIGQYTNGIWSQNIWQVSRKP